MRTFYLATRPPQIGRSGFRDLLVGQLAPELVDSLAGSLLELRVDLIDDAPAGAPDAVIVAAFDQRGPDTIGERLRAASSSLASYRVCSTIVRDDLLPRSQGRFAGVKILHPVKRTAGLTPSQFARHWKQVHAPLALRHHPAMQGYVINAVTEREPNSAAEWDGFTESYYASAAEARDRFFDSPEGRRVILDDVARFIGEGATYWATELVLV